MVTILRTLSDNVTSVGFDGAGFDSGYTIDVGPGPSETLTRKLHLKRQIVETVGGGGANRRYIYHLTDTVLASDSLFSRVIRLAPVQVEQSRSLTSDWTRQGSQIRPIQPTKPIEVQEQPPPPAAAGPKILRRWLSDYVPPPQESITTIIRRERTETVPIINLYNRVITTAVTKQQQASTIATWPNIDVQATISARNKAKTRKLKKLYKLASILDLIKSLDTEVIS